MAMSFRSAIAPPIDPERSRTSTRSNATAHRGGDGGASGGVGGNGGAGDDGGALGPHRMVTESMAMSLRQLEPRSARKVKLGDATSTVADCQSLPLVDCCPLFSHTTAPPGWPITRRLPIVLPNMWYANEMSLTMVAPPHAEPS